jgi:kynureninase
MNDITRDNCKRMDEEDSLSAFRDRFVIPNGMVYLDGNSLGMQPRAALSRALEVVEKEWGQGLIKSWNSAGWWDLPTRLGDKIARLVGAGAGEIVATDSTGINLHKVLAAALSLVPERRVIVMEGSNFPTDNYMAQGLVAQLGDDYEIRFVEEHELEAAIDETVAAVCLTQVHFRSGRILNMREITGKIQAVGAISIWDLCHSAGAFEVALNDCNVDFAVGCSYKYLNGGPGSPGFVFIAGRHHGVAHQPLSGWWGHADPFAFERDYRPAKDVRQMLSGTQPIISLAVAEVGIDLFLEADMAAVRRKSENLTSLFIELVESRCADFEFGLVSPRQASLRGSQVSLNHEQGFAIIQALMARNVIGDFRAPLNMRFGFTPLYTAYTDVWDAVQQLVEIMEAQEWRRDEFNRRGAVT